MTVHASAERAHDELLEAMPPGASHDGVSCPICVARVTASTDVAPENPQEVSNVTDKITPRTFTEAEHEAILTTEVRREVASATEVKDARIAELETQVDTLEAEKASLETKVTEAETAFETFKTESEQAAEVAARRESRVDAVKRISARELPESYFTEARVTRWAEMADESFNELLEDLAVPAISELAAEEASQLEGLEGEARITKLGDILASRREAADAKVTAPQRQTAAFNGSGKQPGVDTKDSEQGVGTTGTFLRAVHG